MSEQKVQDVGVNRRQLLKLVVLGDSGVGKTALLRQYVQKKFIEAHQATIGADLLTKIVTTNNINVSLQIWDTGKICVCVSGQERYDALGSTYFRGADACVFVYDISSKTSFAHVDQWRQSFIKNTSNDRNVSKFKFLLLGNKSDLQEDLRQVSTSDAAAYAQTNGMLFFETSAKTASNVDEAFLALLHAISTVEDVVLYTSEVGQKIQLIEQEMEAKNRSAFDNCACVLI
ncbi:hypothetical protein RFI_14093 [Reticulomyxa filosa]|uniref:Uncharacterized protein n=1 Tax=Reticulomyxa filosa TaxID=46433 RepID=X6NAM9_RETFI|nr:hypothetical protein RFI_14093 [Reticulomyxa filosa]|eukprot:ETO23091.1 hypothetical protein RFI_14093 [Reticulomyxa filosa]